MLADGRTDCMTDWQTQTDFIICPMLYAIAMEQINFALLRDSARSGLPHSHTWTFFTGVMAEALRADIDWKSAFFLSETGSVWHKISNRKFPLTNHLSCQKTGRMGLLYGITIWAEVSFLSQFARLTDGQTDRRIDGRNFVADTALHSMHRAVKCYL